MNIFESTFEKHKKLMLENLGLIQETELYHATSKENAEKIKIDGPNLKLVGTNFFGGGMEQGEGFYFYKKKQQAIDHAKEFSGEVIIIFDQNINPNVFDIDYEANFNHAGKYIQDNIIFFEENKDQLGIFAFTKDPKGNVIGVGVRIGRKFGGISLNSDDVSIADATKMAFIFNSLKKINKSKFDEFENLVLKNANVIKYNGEDKIYPIRIEDLDGNIIWKK